MIPIAKPQIGKEEINAVVKVLESGMLTQGRVTSEFEERFASFCQSKHAIMTSSGTTALHTCLNSMGINKGDEVITSAFTFVAGASTILMQGAAPVFADIRPDTFNIDPVSVEKAVTDKTRAIVPVDLYGQIYDYRQIKKLAQENNLKIVEDACQSVGAESDGKKAGTFGNVSAFSLYATKNLVSGEGGMITTDDDDAADKARRFINHGQAGRYDYVDLGYNYRATDIQAAIGLVQLKKIDMLNSRRIENAKLLSEGLDEIKGIIVPHVRRGNRHVFHQYTIKVDGYKLSRDQLLERLRDNGIGANIYYPQPLHLAHFYRRFGYKKGDFPVAEEMSKKVLSIPVHPGVDRPSIEKIIGIIKKC